MSEIQAIIFDNKKWTTMKAREWLKTHNFKPIKAVHRTLSYLRYRIRDPRKYKSFSLSKKIDGIRMVIGYK